MDLDHALTVFRLCYYRFRQDPSEAASMLLTDNENQAIADLEKVVLKYSDLVASNTGSTVTKAARCFLLQPLPDSFSRLKFDSLKINCHGNLILP